MTIVRAVCFVALAFGLLATPLAQAGVTEEEAHAIGVDAYVYFYALITMDVTRKQLSNMEPGKETLKGPMNMFNHAAEYPPANFEAVVRPNFDTLYSPGRFFSCYIPSRFGASAWLLRVAHTPRAGCSMQGSGA
jgi:Protein of unknown function (DUF1254)